MPRKPNPQKKLARLLKTEYRNSLNNPSLLAKRLGITRETAKKLVDKIESGELPVESDQWVDFYMNRLEVKPEYFEGYERAPEIRRKKSRDWKGREIETRDYQVELGQTVPPDRYHAKSIRGEGADGAETFKVIIKGKERGEEKYYSTHYWDTAADAFGEARRLMQKYKKFEGGAVIVRTFKRLY